MTDGGLRGDRYHQHPLPSVAANVFNGGGLSSLSSHGFCRRSLLISLLHCCCTAVRLPIPMVTMTRTTMRTTKRMTTGWHGWHGWQGRQCDKTQRDKQPAWMKRGGSRMDVRGTVRQQVMQGEGGTKRGNATTSQQTEVNRKRGTSGEETVEYWL